MASFLGEVANPGLAFSFLGHLSVPPVVSVFTLSDAWN